MKNLLTLLFFVVLIVLSCKKKEEPIPANNSASTSTSTTGSAGSTAGTTTGGTTTGGTTTGGSSTGGTTTGGSTTGGTTGGIITPEEWAVNGVLTVRTVTVETTPVVQYLTEAEAFFSNDQFAEITPTAGINAGQVLLNNTPLSFNQPTINTYFLGSVTNLSKTQWNLKGGNSVPAFTFNASFAHPDFQNPEVLPSVISKSVGTTIALKLSNFTYGSISLDSESANIRVEQGFGFLFPGSSTVTITPHALEMTYSANSATLTVQIHNSVTTTVQGKDFRFEKVSVLKRIVALKP